MAKARSPEYPAIGLKDAVDKVKLVYDKDYQNKLPKRVVAEHMGYKGLNGGSLPIIAALGKYGLLEGRADETRVSDTALAIIAHGAGTPERLQALKTAAENPDLFSELDQKFPGGKASDSAIRSYLLTQKFIPAAADTAIRTYRETKQFVEAESGGYTPASEPEPAAMTSLVHETGHQAMRSKNLADQSPVRTLPGLASMLQETFALDEGPVTLSFPAQMSLASYQDLEDHLNIFLRKAKRRADAIRAHKEMIGDPDDQ